MRKSVTALKAVLLTTTAVAALGSAIGTAEAGGFAIREQSAQFQGSSFAGSAAGGGLSSMYWNPAALGQASWGLVSESHFSGIFGQAKNTVTSVNGSPAEVVAGAGNPFVNPLYGAALDSGDVASPALVGASYYAYRLSERLTLGLSLTSGFGLTTKPTNLNYMGSELGRTTKLFTINAAPTLAFQIAPGITIGAGVQVQYAKAKLGFGVGPASTVFDDADDIAFGGTAGVLFQPAPGTSIGLGYRSQLSHDLDGDFTTNNPAPFKSPASAELNLPDIVTLSLRQSISSNMRLLGTVEWSNWSRFKDLTLPEVGLSVPANWSDGWFFALGGEYDYAPGWTLRVGVAYEISPVDDPTKRFTSIPDADRWWLSAGATVQLTQNMSADFAYSHVFIENGDFEREGPSSGYIYRGYSESQVDIWSVSLKTTWGGEAPLAPLK
ncbi:MAG: OmpP1/FadL family transporter [Hyphomicrobiaceae bacterium]